LPDVEHFCAQGGFLLYTIVIHKFKDAKEGEFPIYVHIHGGFLAHGSSAELGVKGIVSNLVSRGIVVVTMNYRLGAYGNSFDNIIVLINCIFRFPGFGQRQ